VGKRKVAGEGPKVRDVTFVTITSSHVPAVSLLQALTPAHSPTVPTNDVILR
jgi:hypothetical protein